jgi:hypothetical protein
MKWTLAIPSLGRSAVIGKHPLLAQSVVVVAERERKLYTTALPKDQAIAVLPDSIKGIAQTRNWILDNVRKPEDEFLVMCDDDIEAIQYMMSMHTRSNKDPDYMVAVMERTAQLALDGQVGLFGYAHTPNPKERRSGLPFILRTWLSAGVIGFVDPSLRFDSSLMTKEDVDISLQSIARHRYLIQDLRYAWVCQRWNNVGGMASFRTQELEYDTLKFLKKKWGDRIISLNYSRRKSGMALRLNLR